MDNFDAPTQVATEEPWAVALDERSSRILQRIAAMDETLQRFSDRLHMDGKPLLQPEEKSHTASPTQPDFSGRLLDTFIVTELHLDSITRTVEQMHRFI